MSMMSARDRVSRLDRLDPAVAGPGEVGTGLTDIRLLRGWLDSREAALACRQDELAATIGAAPAVDALGRSGKTSRRHAARITARAHALDASPSLSTALESGTVSADHADAFAVVTGSVDDRVRERIVELDTEVVSAATDRTPEQFRRHLRDLVRQLSDDDGIDRSEQQRDEARVSLTLDETSGMGVIRGELHPDDFQRVNRRLDAEINALRKQDRHAGKRRDQLAAIALVDLVCGQRATSRVPAEVIIHVPLDAINGAPGASKFGEYLDGAPVPVETIRRHACDANIIPAVLSGTGQPLDVGRAQRLATRAQRQALRTMYRTCAIGDCPISFDRCEIHHALEWRADQGPTDLKFLFPTCSYHHHRLHEGRWRAQLDESTRQLTITYPDGTRHSGSHPDLLTHAS
jgi:hypothetical protein